MAREYAAAPITNPLQEHERLFVRVPNLESLDPRHPPYLMLRFDNVLSIAGQKRIFQAWLDLQSLNPKHHIAREMSRSTTPALHVGIWEMSSATPYVTRETVKQTEEVIIALDRLLLLVKSLMVPKILSLTRRFIPNQFSRNQRHVFVFLRSALC